MRGLRAVADTSLAESRRHGFCTRVFQEILRGPWREDTGRWRREERYTYLHVRKSTGKTFRNVLDTTDHSTIGFSGTLGALRANAEFASYGASRASVRQLAQALAREFSPKGIHVAHAIANGRITDADNEDTKNGKHIAAEAVGKT